MLAVFSKDVKNYFLSLTGYIFMGVFLLISGIFFALSNVMAMSANYNSVLGSITFIFLLVVPILTMNLMSGEVSRKTDILLLTSPLSLSGIVIGKYLAAVFVFLLTLLITCIYPVILSFFGTIAVWEIVGGIIGFFFLGCAFIAVGLFVSALTENQINAALGTFGALLVIMFIDWIRLALPAERIAGLIFTALLLVAIAGWLYYNIKNLVISLITLLVCLAGAGLLYWFNSALFDGFLIRFFGYFSLLQHYNNFQMGILSVSVIVYYLSFSFIFLFLTVRILEKKRWS